jgi:hypothetical protein
MPADKNETEKRFDINSKATPEEIMAAWKAALQANGEDVNETFIQQHISKR